VSASSAPLPPGDEDRHVVGRALASVIAGPDATQQRQRRVWRLVGPLFGAVWIVFLSEPATESWANPDPVLRWCGILGVGLSAAGFVVSVFLLRHTFAEGGGPARRWSVISIVAQVVGVVLACLAAQQHGLVGTVFISVSAVYLLRTPRALLVTVALAVVLFVLPRVIPGWEPEDSTIIALVLATLATYGFAQLVNRNRQLQAAQEEVAVLAVSRERERISRDMHDVLGHSLTVISVKSELAGRLVTADPERAAAELADIQALARSALADVRGMVTATRHVTLAGELAVARRALDAAGIDAQLPGAVDAVPEGLRELFAWTLREGTTNVLRHAAATRVAVTLAPDRLVVEDDGRGAGPCPDDVAAGSPGSTPGHGLDGLRERAAAVGAVLEAGSSRLGGFRLAVRVPRGAAASGDGRIGR
jgi:two-component system sensor histidine kinase DesK